MQALAELPVGPWSWWVNPLLLAASLAIPVLVSVHVLLHKRDVPATIGWIGLVWLSPVAGGALYLVFGINRVRRRARQLREERNPQAQRAAQAGTLPPHHPFAPLDQAVARITGWAGETGNAVRMFRNGDEAYPAMLAAIATARHSIALSSYILRDDAAGAPFVDALIAAQRNGIAVRVLIDGIGGGWLWSGAYWRLRRNGVPAARFMHAVRPWRLPSLNLRTHRKILVVDGRVAFAGGMNISAQNVLAGCPRFPVQDLHFGFEGPVVRQLLIAFFESWSFEVDEEPAADLWFPPLAPRGPAMARAITSGPDEDYEKIELLMLEAIACARRSIRIVTPYFLPDERVITSLALARMRGVEVDILLPAQSDHRVLDWATRAHIGPLLAEGCRIWRNPPPFDHSKVMVVDQEWCLVGSANWDIRSLRLNFEMNVEIYDRALAARLEALMRSREVDLLSSEELESRSFPHRLRDAAARLLMPYV